MIQPLLRKMLSITQRGLFSSACLLCAQYHAEGTPLCALCQKLFLPLGPACEVCACVLFDEGFLRCGACIQQKPFFDKVLVAYRLDPALRHLIHAFKYHKALYLKKTLSQFMLKALEEAPLSSQCLVPVPLHPQKLRERGFNQALELSKFLAKKTKLPCEALLCQKLIATSPQVALSGQARNKNLKKVFLAKASPYQHITLVDDIITTGATVNELARAFKSVGVRVVDVWCCARAVLD